MSPRKLGKTVTAALSVLDCQQWLALSGPWLRLSVDAWIPNSHLGMLGSGPGAWPERPYEAPGMQDEERGVLDGTNPADTLTLGIQAPKWEQTCVCC